MKQKLTTHYHWFLSLKTNYFYRKAMTSFGMASLLLIFLSSCQKIDILDEQNVAITNGTSESVIPIPTNPVMMQVFYWNTPISTPAGTWWQNLSSKAVELKNAGITSVWIPPAYKGGGGVNDVGYGVYDRYDLGEFNQKGSVPTRYGTIGQLKSAVSAFRNNGIAVIGDIVMNHLVFADAQQPIVVNGQNLNLYTKFDYTARNNKYSSYKWNNTLFSAAQQAPNNGWYQWQAYDFNPYSNNDAYDNLLGCEIKYNGGTAGASASAETVAWGKWLTTELSLDGYRLDATKHIFTGFVNSWLDQVKTGGRWAVSEAWFRDLGQLQSYASSLGGRSSLFDVPLHYTFVDMSNGNGAWDMRGLQFAGFTESNQFQSVSFVDNHDTDDPNGGLRSPVVNLKMLAYAYILTREKGYPCVYYKDYYEYGLGNQIKKLLSIRKTNAYGAAFEYTSVNDANIYVYSRAGNGTNKGLLLMLNDGGTNATKGITTPFKSKSLTDKTGNTAGTITTNASGYAVFPVNARNYAVWTPNN